MIAERWEIGEAVSEVEGREAEWDNDECEFAPAVVGDLVLFGLDEKGSISWATLSFTFANNLHNKVILVGELNHTITAYNTLR